jgi:adenosylhomocysteine nucleosidase
MSRHTGNRLVAVLAPMPLEMQAIVTAFGLSPTSDADGAPWTGTVGNSDVTAIHIGMGPPATRAATARLLEAGATAHGPFAHVMIAGICGGLDPTLDVGTVINPDTVIDHTSGATYVHTPPGAAPRAGKLVTTEGVSLDRQLSQRFFEEGCVGVDMESAAVAEICEAHGCPWSVYRCIGDRHFDGLLDERVVALTNPDGSGDMARIGQLVAADPDVAARLERLSHDAALAAQRGAEAAVRGCLALDG